MLFLKFLPGALKELLKHVPTVLFQVVEWKVLMAELPVLSRRLLQKEGHSELFDQLAPELQRYDVKLTHEAIEKIPYEANEWSARICLHLYFVQIFSPHGLFLDLRPIHFDTESTELKWHPSGLWTQFDEEFRNGLIQVYDGFYMENQEAYFQGLEKIGLVGADWTDADKEKLGELFKAQFDHEMIFDLENFRSVIFKLADFLLQKKVNITKDFLYLGIYLVTLYSHLQESQVRLPVREIYLKVREESSLP